MSDHIKGFVVALQEELREDDAEHLLKAIGLMQNVADVQPVKVGIDDQINRMKIRRELIDKLWDVLR